jgi:hypothetical protein
MSEVSIRSGQGPTMDPGNQSKDEGRGQKGEFNMSQLSNTGRYYEIFNT